MPGFGTGIAARAFQPCPVSCPRADPAPQCSSALHARESCQLSAQGSREPEGRARGRATQVGLALTQCRHRSRISWKTLVAICRAGSGRSGPDSAGGAGASSSSASPPRSSPISWEEVASHQDGSGAAPFLSCPTIAAGGKHSRCSCCPPQHGCFGCQCHQAVWPPACP